MVNDMFLSHGLRHGMWGKAIISLSYHLDKIPCKENKIVLMKYGSEEDYLIIVLMEIGRSSRIDDEVVQDKRQRDDNDLQDERQDQPKEEEVEPRRCKRARTEKLFGPDFVSFMEIRKSSRKDDEVVQDQRQRDDNDLQDERQDQPKEEEVEPRRCKRARTKKSFRPDFVSFMVENEPTSYQEAVNFLEWLQWNAAIKSYKWIFKKKMKADGTIDKYKSRLVIKGFRQREGLGYFDTYWPVTRITSIKMASLSGLAVQQLWTLCPEKHTRSWPSGPTGRGYGHAVRGRGSFNKFTWYKNKVLYTRIAAYSDQTRPNLTFVSTSWRHPWDPTLGITLIRMSAMANATPIVTTVTKTANKEKASDAAPRVNILDFCEEHYEDILPIIMEKARRDKRKEVQTRLNFGENSKKTRRERENSLNSRAENSPTRFHPERSRTRGCERRDDRNVFNRLSHRRKSVHERLSDTYSLSTTKFRPSRADSRDPSHSRGHSLSRERPRMEDRPRGIEESYGDKEGDSCFRYKLGGKGWIVIKEIYVGVDGVDPENKMKYCKDSNPRTGSQKRPSSIFRQQKKYVKDPVKIHNIKQRDGETIEDFIERFKVTECMRIFGFMHGVNNPELTKRLNEHVPKTMEEMMTVTTAFIRGEAVAASKKKGHSQWKSQDQSKRHASERKSDVRGQSREGQGSSKFTPSPKSLKKSSRPKQESSNHHRS
ncbi:reverse transcriptase domain-containing protein, partial [Tanacetum coccineum]